MISNTDSTLSIYLIRHMRVKVYKAADEQTPDLHRFAGTTEVTGNRRPLIFNE
jgi:hypothetical protein